MSRGEEEERRHTEHLTGHDGPVEFLLHELSGLTEGGGDLIGFLLDRVIRSGKGGRGVSSTRSPHRLSRLLGQGTEGDWKLTGWYS